MDFRSAKTFFPCLILLSLSVPSFQFLYMGQSADTRRDAQGGVLSPMNVSGIVAFGAGITGTPATVEFLLDGVVIQSVTAPDAGTTDRYTIQWDTTRSTNASHSWTVRDTAPTGEVAASYPFAVLVTNPVVPILYSVSGTATLSTGGPLAGVVVTGGGQTATSAADGTYSLTGLPAGTVSVFASKVDYAINPAMATVTLGPDVSGVNFVGTYVPPPDTTPPSCAITSPADGYHLNGPVLKIQATASDNVAVVKVEFLVDGKVQATLTATPYAVNLNVKKWTSGSHILTVRGYDAAGNVGTSAPVSVVK